MIGGQWLPGEIPDQPVPSLGFILPGGTPAGETFLVVPRLGTISPWSSKATDIARNCGLAQVRRIERGTLFFVQAKERLDRTRIAGLLHDRMTESVLASLEEAQGMFRHIAPRPLERVPLAQLEAANTRLGLESHRYRAQLRTPERPQD